MRSMIAFCCKSSVCRSPTVLGGTRSGSSLRRRLSSSISTSVTTAPTPDGRVVARVHVAAAGDQERGEGASGDQPAGRERPGTRSGRAGVGVLMGGTRARGVGATWGCDVDVIRGTAYRLAATRLAGLPRPRELSRARQG